MERLEDRVLLSAFVVTNTSDNGPGSLRQAILDANAHPNEALQDVIAFRIPGTGTQTLSLQSQLPDITDTVKIDGTSQPGYAGVPLVQLRPAAGLSVPIDGLRLLSAGNTVQGLTFGGFNAAIHLAGAGSNIIRGNYLGTDAAGAASDANSVGVLVNSANNVIGDPLFHNLISGNRWGVQLISDPGHPTGGNTIRDNTIGPDVTGKRRIGNGAGVDDRMGNNTIGSPANGNVISGNGVGVNLATGDNSSGGFDRVQGNRIGVDAQGLTALGNTGGGIQVSSSSNQIGGRTPELRNVISGNLFGIGILPHADSNTVLGNYIGVGADGHTVVGNQGPGIDVASSHNTIGGVQLAGNVVSGNGGLANISLSNASYNTVQGNHIGTNDLGFGIANAPGSNPRYGILDKQGVNNVIGGTARDAGNIVSGNAAAGIYLLDSTGEVLLGNLVGVSGSNPMLPGNHGPGILVQGGAVTIGDAIGHGNTISGNDADGIQVTAGSVVILGNSIGAYGYDRAVPNRDNGILVSGGIAWIGTSPQPPGTAGGPFAAPVPNGGGNVIAYNHGSGIDVVFPAGAAAGGTATISGNSIYSNDAPGIDLGDDGITPNDPGDTDTGPHGLQNFPVLATALTFARSGLGPTQIFYAFNSRPIRHYRMEFFSSPTQGLSGHGEGKTYLGSDEVTTDDAGNATSTVRLTAMLGSYITATATDEQTEETSEFAAPIRSTIPPPFVVARHVFYNASAWDGNGNSLNDADNNAVAPDKEALLPGQTATFRNYTSYSRGINGIMVDVNFLPNPSSEEFTFRVGNDNDPSHWPLAPAPSQINVITSPYNNAVTDRVAITWLDNAIKNEWLQVTVKGPNGGPVVDVFYFGNAIGETGNHPADAQVTAQDELLARANPRNLVDNPAPIDFNYDFNRDKKVDAFDQIVARAYRSNFLTALKLISAPAAASSAAAPPRSTMASPAPPKPSARLTLRHAAKPMALK